MKTILRLCVTIVFLTVCSVVNAQTLYLEDFEDEANGATSGTAAGSVGGTWSVSYGGGGTFSKEDILIMGNSLYAGNTSSEAVWSSSVVDISSAGYAILSIDIGSAFVEANDYIRCYYRINGGPETLFYELVGGTAGGFSLENPASAIVAGDNVQIIVRTRNDRDTEIIIIFPAEVDDAYAFDNVTITAADVLYSRKSDSWTNVAGGFGGTGTWSTNASGTPACGCVPLNDIVAVIQNGHTITLPASQTAVGASGTANLAPGAVDIRSGGILEQNGFTLGIQQGLFVVQSGGILNNGGASAGEDVSFNANVGGATFTVDGTASIDDFILTVEAENLHYIQGSGTLSMIGGIRINADDATLTNDMTTAVSVAGNLVFDEDNSAFVNNRQITFSGDVAANSNDDDNNEIINNSGAILSFNNMDAFASGTGDGSDLSIFNSGTINQAGTFIDIDNVTNAGNDINNLAGGVWNYSGTGHDTNLRLFANNPTNTFIYTRSGNQNIITPVDAYNNLLLEDSGTKTALGNFSVSGDWDRTGTATFANGGFTVTFNGTSTQTLTTHDAGEAFQNLTINKAGGTVVLSGTDVTVANTLTLTSRGVDLNGRTLLVTNTAATAITGSGFVISERTTAPYGFLARRMATAGTPTYTYPFATSGGSAVNVTFQLTNAGAGSNRTVSIATYPTPANNTPYPTGVTHMQNAGGVDNSSNVVNRFWIVNTSGYTTQPNAAQTLRFLAGETQGAAPRTAQRWNGADQWLTGVGSNSTTAFPVPAATINTSSVWAISSSAAPLPIVLAYYKAQVRNDQVLSTWKTTQEINNDFFTVQKTIDFETFYDVGVIDGKGDSKELNSYAFADDNPFVGRSYYRLKQTDFDGKFTYSEPVMIDFEGPEFPVMSAFPNPSSGNEITVQITGLKDATTVPVVIYDQRGLKLFETTLSETVPGTILGKINVNHRLPQGIYIIKAGRTHRLIRKIIVN